MKLRKVRTRGLLFSFYELGIVTNVYLILGDHRYYMIDSYLGESYVKKILDYLYGNYPRKEVLLINSHGDWDHVWGNSYFPKSQILGHLLCKKHIVERGGQELESYGSYAREEIILREPSIVFQNSLEFPDDELLIFHSPGHSEDSISILDRRDRLVYVGDNLERPLPHVQWQGLETYKASLRNYYDLDVDLYIGGHTGLEDRSLVRHNLDYLERIFELDLDLDLHKDNIDFLRSRDL